MEFRILGPLEVLDDGRSLEVSGAKQRSLLAVLLLNANRVVSSDRLISPMSQLVSLAREALNPATGAGSRPQTVALSVCR